jgi:hypothetical protein
MSDTFFSRWGIKDLDDERWLNVPGFIMRNWSKFVTVAEWAFILQVMSYKYDTEKGAAKPSLSSIQNEMGYDQIRSVQRLKSSLIEKGLLKVTWVPGYPDTYYFNSFTKGCKEADEARDKNVTPKASQEQGMTKMSGGGTSFLSEGDMTKMSDEELEVKDSESKNENIKDSSALHSEVAPSDIGELSQDAPITETPVVEELEAPIIQAEEHPIVIENIGTVVEESASQLEAPECSEIAPVEETLVLESEQADPHPIEPEDVPDVDVAAVIDEAEELVKANKVALDNCYNEIVRRAFAPLGKPLNYSGIVTNHAKFLRGLFREGDDGAGPERLKYQLMENPMSPVEIAGMTIWIRQECGLKQLPKTCSTLRERCDEFRALYDYGQWVAKGQKVVDQIMGGANVELESKPQSRVANAQKPPSEADMTEVDWKAEERKYQERLREREKANIPA